MRLFHRIAVGIEDLPTAAVAREKHKLLGPVDLDARSGEWPVRESGAFPDLRRDFLHVRRPERLLEDDGHLIEIPVDDVRVGSLLVVVVKEDASRRAHRAGIFLPGHPARQIDLVHAVVDDVAA